MNLGSVKGRWGQIEAERKKVEEEKALVSEFYKLRLLFSNFINFWLTTNQILLAVHAKTPATSTKNVLLKREIFLVSLLTLISTKM